MWKKGWKRKEEGELAVHGDDASRGRKVARKDNAPEDDDSGFVCELSNTRRVSVRILGGKILVDIREYYSKDGKLLPGKKGIALPLDQWKILRENIDEIDKALTENA